MKREIDARWVKRGKLRARPIQLILWIGGRCDANLYCRYGKVVIPFLFLLFLRIKRDRKIDPPPRVTIKRLLQYL